MANKMFAEVVIAGSYKELSKSTRGATKELTGFEKTAKKISTAISAAFAGVAFQAIQSLAGGILDLAKAAGEDAKSSALLNKQMENTWHASKKTEAQISAYIDTMSNMSGIVDDELKPAFAKIVTVTHKASTAMKFFNMAMDISAGTGKDLNTVSQAFAKYIGGNSTALDKLVPGLKNAGDKMAFLKQKYDGMAAVAGKNDPFARINAVFDNFKEKIGAAFLPIISQFADWLASPRAQKQMDKFAKSVGEMFAWFTSPEGQKGMQDFLNKITDIANAINKLVGYWDKLKPLIDAMGWLTSNMPNLFTITSKAADFFNKPSLSTAVGINPNANSGIVTYNYNVTMPNVDGKTVVVELQKLAKRKGVPLSKLLQ